MITAIVTSRTISAPAKPNPKKIKAIKADNTSEMNINGKSVAMNESWAMILATFAASFCRMIRHTLMNTAAEMKPVASKSERMVELSILSTNRPYSGRIAGIIPKAYHRAKMPTTYVRNDLFFSVILNDWRNDGLFSKSCAYSGRSFKPYLMKAIAEIRQMPEITTAANM